jgi:hypothetical protein
MSYEKRINTLIKLFIIIYYLLFIIYYLLFIIYYLLFIIFQHFSPWFSTTA